MNNQINNSPKENKDLISLKLNSENIVEIELSPALSQIRKKDLQYINEQICSLGGGRKMGAYISFSGFVALDRSAKKYRATPEYAKYRLANAFLIDTFSKVLLYNFYFDADTSEVPVKSFTTKPVALEWLNTFS